MAPLPQNTLITESETLEGVHRRQNEPFKSQNSCMRGLQLLRSPQIVNLHEELPRNHIFLCVVFLHTRWICNTFP